MNASRRLRRWLVAAAIASVAINLLLLGLLLARGVAGGDALTMTSWGFTVRLKDGSPGVDSLRPMLAAWERTRTRSDRDIYGLFFDQHTKFQYPPSSLLIFDVLQPPPAATATIESDTPLRRWWGIASQWLVLATIVLALATLELAMQRQFPNETATGRDRLARLGIALFLAATFYPLTRAHNLGQIQVLLNACAACGVLLHLAGWRASSGVCFGVCCLIKPQFGLLALWGLLRRQWRFVAGLAAVALPLAVVSLAQFGFTNHVRYLEVLSAIARTGETFWPNQSVNGLLNRLLSNGDPVSFSRTEFPPAEPVVRALTLLSAVLILVAALWASKRWCPRPGSSMDLAVILAAATLASPIAWEHHYGVFLPLFALALPVVVEGPPHGRWGALLLGMSFLAMASVVRIPTWFFADPLRGVLASHLFFGALVFFGLLVVLRTQERDRARIA